MVIYSGNDGADTKVFLRKKRQEEEAERTSGIPSVQQDAVESEQMKSRHQKDGYAGQGLC